MLLDRADQRRVLGGALASAAAGRGRSVLVAGAPGDGSSALLDDAARSTAAGGGRWLVLGARAAPDEQALDNALLQQVLLPLLDEVDVLGVTLDPAPRAALEVAVGRSAPLPGLVPLPMAVLLALEAVGRRRPVLLVVDDAQWADPSSAAVLRFLARRLSRTAVCLVVAAPGGHGEGAWGDVDVTVALTPLSAAAVLAAVDERFSDLDPVDRDLLVRMAQGRPRRLADLMDLARPGGAAGDPAGGLPLRLRGARAPSVQRARDELAAATPSQRHRLLLLGLLDDPAAAPHLEAAAAQLTASRVGHGLALADDVTPRARPATFAADPLLVAVAVAEAAPDEVERARTAWFEVLCRLSRTDGPEDPTVELAVRLAAEARRQSAHLARGSDPALGAGLRRSARALRRFDLRRAGDLFALAAAVDDPSDRAASLLLAAEQALLGGRETGAEALASGAHGASSPVARGVAERLAALRALEREDRAAAVEHLGRALDHLAAAASAERPAVAAPAAEEALATAAALVVVAGRSSTTHPALDRAADALPSPAAERLRSLARLTDTWDATTPREQQEALAVLVEVLSASSLPVLRGSVDVARVLGRVDRVEELLRRRAPAQPATGPSAVDHHLAACAAALETGLDDAAEHLRLARAALRHAAGRTAAVEQAEALVELLREGATARTAPPGDPTGPPPAETTELATAVWATAHRHRLRGEMAEAAAVLSALWPPVPAVVGPGALVHALPYVHALAETRGDGAALRRVADELSAWARGSGSPLATTTHLLCRAVLADGAEERLALVEEAVRSASDPVVAGPAHLALGMLLRRARQGVSARVPLQRAAAAYEAAGLRAFAELARRELAATAPQRPPRRVGSSVLTSQEQVVAELAASEASNAEIALSLGISSRTVAHHLQHVYAKLGITGRRQLAARLARTGAGP